MNDTDQRTSPGPDLNATVQCAGAVYDACGTLDPRTTGIVLAIARKIVGAHSPQARRAPAWLCSHPEPAAGSTMFGLWLVAHPIDATELSEEEALRGRRICTTDHVTVCAQCSRKYEGLIEWPCQEHTDLAEAVRAHQSTRMVPETVYWVNGLGGRIIAQSGDAVDTVMWAPQQADTCAGLLNMAYQTGRLQGPSMEGRPLYEAVPTSTLMAAVAVDERVHTPVMRTAQAQALAQACKDAYARGLDAAERAIFAQPCPHCHAPGGMPCTSDCVPTVVAARTGV
ncbi:hypothetical protein BJF83_21365 [Nocardiopsis sp. CNR-923]|uniref:hypothetical protein n=1 Tax=Nocardiopsis sp. CNR-923 TaxID=1904965 RepID=UPI00096371A5|nr:hypothetical protein [Nocardiopsis sp. CNR-923]OLT26352.1 hypothetical protein BJF83_21365 [Nocardiopsis sp. CNR-923]